MLRFPIDPQMKETYAMLCSIISFLNWNSNRAVKTLEAKSYELAMGLLFNVLKTKFLGTS